MIMKLMKSIFLIAVILLSSFFAGILKGQEFNTQADRDAYTLAMQKEIANPDTRYLYYHADAYGRLLQIRALRSIGYDIKQSPSFPILDANPTDTGIAKDAVSFSSYDQNETTIAINKKNPKIIIAGANDARMYNQGMPSFTTTDQGNNWRTNFVPIPNADNSAFPIPLGDPAFAADDSGLFYYAYLASDNVGLYDNLVIATSKDGKSWINGAYVVAANSISGFEDKEQIAVDNSPGSHFHGRVYTVWMHFESRNSNTGGVRIAWSDDKCKTWSDVVNVTDGELDQFSELKIGKNGEVILTFSVPDGNGGGSHRMLLSTDGGANFSNSEITTYTNYPINYSQREGLKGTYGFRCFPYIAEDIDLKTNRIHLVYGSYDSPDQVNFASILYYVNSSDLGTTWSTPQPVGISNPIHSSLAVDRFCPWVSVNQNTGDAYAVYYSSENDVVNNLLVTVYRSKLTVSKEFTEYPRQVGDRDFDPTLIRQTNNPPFIGDYIGSDAFDTIYAAAWTENRPPNHSDGDVFAYIGTPKHSPNVSVNQPIVIQSESLWLSAPTPNPASNDLIRFSYFLPYTADMNLALYNSAGIEVKTFAAEKMEAGTNTKEYSIAGISSGGYILRLTTPYGRVEKNVIIAK
jgi:hypothetical protein